MCLRDAGFYREGVCRNPNQYFQFIEALKKSGITGGCQVAPPLYCPDNFVTRGQMAVFLAKALGLQFPGARSTPKAPTPTC